MAENKSKLSIVTNGLLKENPTLRLVLGTCPTLAVTTSAINYGGFQCSGHGRGGYRRADLLQLRYFRPAQGDPR